MLACAFVTAVPVGSPILAAGTHTMPLHVRTSNTRIEEVLQYALMRSPSFRDLTATLDLLDRVVYIEEGHCRHREQLACLQLMPGGKNILVQVDPRQSIRPVALQIAHELYHAVEIGREPAVVNAMSLENLYRTIGERSCFTPPDSCWETRAAVAFEALVARQLADTPTRSLATWLAAGVNSLGFDERPDIAAVVDWPAFPIRAPGVWATVASRGRG